MTTTASSREAGSRILVVEDEALIADEIQTRLQRLGFVVVGLVDTADAAYNAAERERPDLVLMDIRLKGSTDGITAAGRIVGNLALPVVYLTAHSDDGTLQRAKETNPYGYILKPFHERDLLVGIELAIHRHRLEQQLKESEIRYASTLASIADGVVATGPQGRVTYLNPVAEALTGWSLAEAMGNAVEMVLPLVSETDRAVIDNPIRTALRDRVKTSLDEPVLLLTKSGEAIPIDDGAGPILDERGRAIGAVMAFRDIRHRRLAADALRVAEDQLRQAQKVEAIGRLAGGVAHDFNNLITVINGCCELLLLEPGHAPDSRALIKEVARAGDRAAALTRQLLAFSRKQILAPAVVDLSTLVREVDRLLRRLIGEDVQLVVRLSSTPVPVLADPSQLEQVVMNLAVDARDAMPTGGTLTIETGHFNAQEPITSTRPEMPAGRYAMLSVSDTGVGMDEHTKAHLFEPFFTTKEVGKGTGLGLATVYGIVKQSGGFIYVYSELGRGTTFKIYLPIAGSESSSALPRETVQPVGGTEAILLVEDDDAVRSVSSRSLRLYGYQVLEANGATAATRLAEGYDSEISLLVTDVVMPGVGGRQLADQLQTLRPGLKVLFLSGYTEDSVIRRGVFEGAADFLQKPVTPSQLALKVREILDRPPA